MADPHPAPRPRRTTTTTRVLVALSIFGVVVLGLAVGGVVWLVQRQSHAEVTEGSFLRVDLGGAVSDAPSVGGLFLDPEQVVPLPTEVARAIRKAGTDTRIKGIYLDLSSPQLGFGLRQEIRSALVDFRATGKPCVVYSEGYETGDYYLASACDRLVIAPAGVSLVAGIATDITYYAGTFEKIGAVPQFEHVGDFKSAVEPYERTGPSEGALEATNSFLDSMWNRFLADVAAGRGRTVDEVRAWVDAPPMSPADAVARGMYDAIAYRDAVEASLDAAKDADFAEKLKAIPPDVDDEVADDRFTSVAEYVKEIRGADAKHDAQIAVVYAEGPIVSGSGDGGLFAETMLADGPFREWLEEVREDDAVRAAVIRVNSPGGSGLASDMMWREIELTQHAGKPVVISMGNYAASGGYYISCSADWIVAQPSTLTGSIGVFGGKIALSGTMEKLGMTQHQFKRGELADLFSSSQPFSDAGRAVFRGYLQGFYDLFVNRVAEGRRRTYDEVHTVAQGRVWTGEQAKERGLVDELGGLDVAVRKAAELAQVEGEYGLTVLPRQRSFVEQVLEDLSSVTAPRVDLSPVPGAEGAVEELEKLQRILSDDGIAAYWAGAVELR